MADKTKSQYRAEILALRRKLKPELQERIYKHFRDWNEQDEAHSFEQWVWRACDKYGEEKLNCRFGFGKDTVEEYRRLWHVLEPLSQDEGKWKEFQDKYFEPELAAKEKPTEYVLLKRFIWKLSDQAVDLVQKLYKRLGGDYPFWDVNEQGKSQKVRAKDYWFIHPDASEAAKEKVSLRAVELCKEQDEEAKRLLSEMYSPFLQLPLDNRRVLLDSTEDAFNLWVAEDFIPHLKQKIESCIRREKDAITKVDEEKINAENERKFEEATTSANKEALKIAAGYRKKGTPIPYFSIAEQMMMKYFKDLILRETGKRMRNNQMELTKAWKDKREAIRGTLREKFKKK